MKPSTSLRGSGLRGQVTFDGRILQIGDQRRSPFLDHLVQLFVELLEHRSGVDQDED
jgi:hypothetical protein